MGYQVRYRAIRDDKILCEVVNVDDKGRPTGAVVVKGVANTKEEARAAALAAAEDPAVKRLLAAPAASGKP